MATPKKVIKSLVGQNPDAKFQVMTVRFTTAEFEALKKKSEKWAHGNKTALIKYAVSKFEPSEADLADVE